MDEDQQFKVGDLVTWNIDQRIKSDPNPNKWGNALTSIFEGVDALKRDLADKWIGCVTGLLYNDEGELYQLEVLGKCKSVGGLVTPLHTSPSLEPEATVKLCIIHISNLKHYEK